MSTRTDRTINSIVGLAEGLSTKLDHARRTILEQLTHLDGLAGRAYDATPVTGGKAELTTVERLASQRHALELNLQGLNDELSAAVLVLRNLHRDCDRIISTRIEVPRCTASGREGALEWGRPDCWDAPVRGPLCFNCYMRERRWRLARGLPTREIDVA